MLNRTYRGGAVLVALVAVCVATAVVATSLKGTPGYGPPVELEVDPFPGVPGDFGRTSALILGSRSLVNQNRRVLADIVAAVEDQVRIMIVVDAHDTRRGVLSYLQSRNVRTDHLNFIEVPIKDVWLRDFGPVFVHGQDGRLNVVDAIYNTNPQPTDDNLPRYIAGYFRLPVVDLPLRLEGGNVLSNGEGLLVFTSKILSHNPSGENNYDHIQEALDRAMPAIQYMFLPPLKGEPTEHVDMFVTFTAHDRVVVATIAPDIDPENSRLLDDHAETLAQYRVGNRGMHVSRIPMGRFSDGIWRSYNNVIFANGVLLVPQYGVEPEVDSDALAVYRELLPDWRVVGVDASGLMEKAGSLHCISINVPFGVEFPTHTSR